MTRKRPDAMTISLGGHGGDHQAQRKALEQLADDLNLIGQRGPSVSHLMRWLADTYMIEPGSTVQLLNIAGHVASGGDIDEFVKQLTPTKSALFDWQGAFHFFSGLQQSRILSLITSFALFALRLANHRRIAGLNLLVQYVVLPRYTHTCLLCRCCQRCIVESPFVDKFAAAA